MVRTPLATLQKIYNLPEFGSTLEFLTMMALSGGRLLKVSRRHETCPKNRNNVCLISSSLTRVELPI